MKKSLLLVVLIASIAVVVASIADPAAPHPAHLHDAAHPATDTPRPLPCLRHDVHKSASRIAHSPAPSRDHPRRRLFGISDVWSWLGDKKQEATLLQAKDKLRAWQNKTHTNATSHANADGDRRLGIKIENTNAAKPPEMGTMFHVIRFFANRLKKKKRLNELEQLFIEISPWGNMAKGDVWQHFYLRRFFLSRAPLETFLACYDVHRRVLEAAGQSFLELPPALLMRELVWRGRFDEALAAYTRLALDDAERRSFTALLFEYEQYEALCSVYEFQDEIDLEREEPLLDPLFILHALKELGRRDELVDRFEMLSHEDQGRAEIQKLVYNA